MSNDIGRRDYLEWIAGTAAVGGTVALAGCSDGGGSGSPTDGSGDGGDGGDGGATGGDGGTTGDGGTEEPTPTETSVANTFPREGTFDIGMGTVPDEGQYNPYNSKRLLIGDNNSPNMVLYDELWQPLPKTGEDYMEQGTLLTDRSYDPDNASATLHIREDSVWHNGDDYTARDLVTHYKMEQFVNDALGNVESFSIADDKTVEISLSEAVNPDILWNSLQMEGTVKHSEFSEWLQKLQDASTDEERDQVLTNLQGWTIEQPVGNGPFKYDRAGSQELVLTNFEDYHRPVPFTEYKYHYLPDLNSVVSAFLGGDLDGQAHMSAPKSTQKQLPDHIVKIRAGTASGGWNLSVNMEHSFLGNRKVRQAIAHLIDRQRMADNTLPSHGYVENMVGLTNKMAPNWLGDALGQYETYQGNNTEKAAALLEEAGYPKEDGTVVDSDGEPVTFEMLTPTWENPSRVTETAKTIFDDFGLQAEISSQPGTQFSNRRSNGDFDMTLFYWWAPHPYSGYQRDFINRQEQINNDTEIEVPSMSGSGSTTIDVQAKLDQLYTETDQAAAKEAVQQIAWTYNNYLPTLPMTQGITTSYIGTEDWHSVPEDSKHYDPLYPTEWWVRTGDLYPTN
ncbi:MAG: ABC transporter substrate-binding protein [Halosimplex sp.]